MFNMQYKSNEMLHKKYLVLQMESLRFQIRLQKQMRDCVKLELCHIGYRDIINLIIQQDGTSVDLSINASSA